MGFAETLNKRLKPDLNKAVNNSFSPTGTPTTGAPNTFSDAPTNSFSPTGAPTTGAPNTFSGAPTGGTTAKPNGVAEVPMTTPTRPNVSAGRGGLGNVKRNFDRLREDSDVGNLTASYLDDDNRLMRIAATKGLQAGNRRGMLNSSMAAGAAMDNLALYATDLAKTRSEQLEDRNVRMEEDVYDSRKNKRDTNAELRLSQKDFEEERRMAKQQFRYDRKSAKKAFEYEVDLQDYRIAGDMDLAMLDADTRTTLMSMEEDMRLKLAKFEADADTKDQLAGYLAEVTADFQQELSTIYSGNMSEEARTEAIRSAVERVGTMTKVNASLFGIELDWDAGTFTAGTATKEEEEEPATPSQPTVTGPPR